MKIKTHTELNVESSCYLLDGVVVYLSGSTNSDPRTLGYIGGICCRKNKYWEIYNDLNTNKSK